MTAKITKNHPLFNRFISLACGLSPENLSCDGECSSTEIDFRYRRLIKAWRAAEAEMGRSVTEDEVWDAAWEAENPSRS
jgi:hypothetical protein